MGIEFIISNNTIVLGQRKEQSNTHLELESGAQKKGNGRVRGVGAFQRERGGEMRKHLYRKSAWKEGVPSSLN